MGILKMNGIFPLNKIIIILFNLLIIFYSINTYATENTHIKKYQRVEYIMGTLFRIEVYSENNNEAESSISKAFKELRKYDLIMSNYNPKSELSKALINAHKYPVKISDELFDVFQKSLYFSQVTKGKFDISVGPVVKLWGFKDKNFNVPAPEQIKKTLAKTGYKNIIIDSENKTIFLKKSGMEIDFGAIGKGYAIDKAVKILKDEGIKSGMIDSVSNQYYLGSPPDSEYWIVGIKHPRKHEKVIEYIEVKDKSVSTSGDYEQFFIYNKKRYSHIIDMKNGFPVETDIVSTTVISENSSDADAISTLLFILNKRESELLLSKFPGISYIKILNKKGKFVSEQKIH